MKHLIQAERSKKGKVFAHVTSWFTHYWSNLIQRMQHAENCGQRFPMDENKSVSCQIPDIGMQVCNSTTSHRYVDTRFVSACVGVDCDASCTPQDRVVLQSPCFFFLTKVQILSPKLWRPGWNRDERKYYLRCFVVLFHLIIAQPPPPPHRKGQWWDEVLPSHCVDIDTGALNDANSLLHFLLYKTWKVTFEKCIQTLIDR